LGNAQGDEPEKMGGLKARLISSDNMRTAISLLVPNGAGFQPLSYFPDFTLGVAQGWYGARRWR
jgi:hypothetical protein